MALRPP